jgi:hypothetical protein
MADSDKDPSVLDYLLGEDGGDSQWYEMEDAWIYIRNVIPGLGADVHFLCPDGLNGSTRSVLKDVMREYDLRRLTLAVPAPVTALQDEVAKVGFVREGRLRDATFYGGQYADIVLMGFHRSEVEKGLPLTQAAKGKKKRRRRRSRRKAQSPGKET